MELKKTPISLLLTNDDGPLSPLTAAFITELRQSRLPLKVTPVLPSEEMSWIAQAISRGKTLRALEHRISDADGYLLDGTPADCAAIGIERLVQPRPDYFTSGINLGTNAGLGFYLNSGTVGAVRQAFLHGVPGAAFSVLAPPQLYSAWEQRDLPSIDAHAEHFGKHVRLSARIMEFLIRNDAWAGIDFFSINFPWDMSDAPQILVTQHEEQQYAELFVELEPLTYILRPHANILQPREPKLKYELPGDLTTIYSGSVSITPCAYTYGREKLPAALRLQAQLDQEFAQNLGV